MACFARGTLRPRAFWPPRVLYPPRNPHGSPQLYPTARPTTEAEALYDVTGLGEGFRLRRQGRLDYLKAVCAVPHPLGDSSQFRQSS